MTRPELFVEIPGEAARSTWKVEAPKATAAELSAPAGAAAGAVAGPPAGAPAEATMDVLGAAAGSGVPFACTSTLGQTLQTPWAPPILCSHRPALPGLATKPCTAFAGRSTALLSAGMGCRSHSGGMRTVEGSMSALAAVMLPAGAAAEAGAFPPEAVRLPCPSLSLSLLLSLLSPVPIVSCAREFSVRFHLLHANRPPLCRVKLLRELSRELSFFQG